MKVTMKQLENFFGADDIKEELLKAINGEYPIDLMKSDILEYNHDEEDDD